MSKVTIYIGDELHEKLKKYADNNERTKSSTVRFLIKEGFKKISEQEKQTVDKQKATSCS